MFSYWFHFKDSNSLGQDLGCFPQPTLQLTKYAHIDPVTDFLILAFLWPFFLVISFSYGAIGALNTLIDISPELCNNRTILILAIIWRVFYQYRKSHCGDKTILRPSYLNNGISYTNKTTSLYRALATSCAFLWMSDHLTMMTSSNGNIFRVIGHLCGEFTGLRWIPCTKANGAEPWYFLWSVSE